MGMMNNGIYNHGGWQYYAGGNGIASGINEGVMNGLQIWQAIQSNKRANEELALRKALQQQQIDAINREKQREQNFQQAIQSGLMQPVSENDALFAAAKNDNSIAYKTTPSGKQAAVLTPEGEQQIQGLMSGGFDASKAMAAAMPYIKAEQLPQMLAAIKTIETIPVEQQLKMLEVLKTKSEIDKNNETWSEPYIRKVGGKNVLLRKNNRGKVEQVSQDVSTTVHNYPQKDFKPTEGDLRYLSYVNQIKKRGLVPMERYQFDQWYYAQTEGIKQENKEKSIEAAKKPWEKTGKQTSISPAKLTYNPQTGQFE